ncbi:anti-sigma factor antagonist [Roseibium denhamense]|uniref:Anti-sigma factor antagonist n=1 Tax=Roseibium denhamense TaxID=76305 RepID=A0ABY1NWQ4_9HYPH|nr:STAS domain-containing protein [Roseibium denhamense]MTI04872.1 anti-sigma factor antagonist [Roseibium denhamense]SMP20288.1 anti-sigma B factor antagonist/stage II sporulation protein AA (anti-sigma F factor antagonist) [Roseibium denhamense]
MADTPHLTIEDEFQDGFRIIRPAGKLETLTAKAFEAHLREAAGADSNSLLIDMTGVDYVTSFGLRSLLIITKQIAPGGRKLILFGVNPSVHEVLRISGFLKILTVADSREAALELVSQDPQKAG